MEPLNGSFVMINKDLGMESQSQQKDIETKFEENGPNMSIQRNTYIDWSNSS